MQLMFCQHSATECVEFDFHEELDFSHELASTSLAWKRSENDITMAHRDNGNTSTHAQDPLTGTKDRAEDLNATITLCELFSKA